MLKIAPFYLTYSVLKWHKPFLKFLEDIQCYNWFHYLRKTDRFIQNKPRCFQIVDMNEEFAIDYRCFEKNAEDFNQISSQHWALQTNHNSGSLHSVILWYRTKA